MIDTDPEEHSPSPVDKFHGFHSQCSGHDVISVVSASTDHHKPIHLAHYKDKASRPNESQQACPYEGKLADWGTRACHREYLGMRDHECGKLYFSLLLDPSARGLRVRETHPHLPVPWLTSPWQTSFHALLDL